MNAAQSCVAAVWKRLQSSDRPAAPGDFHHLASTCGADLWVLANVLRQTSKASAMKRSFFVKLNLDEVGHAIVEYDDAESLGHWFRGYLVGAHGKPPRSGAPAPHQAGHAYGLAAFHETEQFRNKQAAIANLRWHPDAKPMPSHMPDGCPVPMPDSCHSDGSEQRASSIQHPAERERADDDATPPPVDSLFSLLSSSGAILCRGTELIHAEWLAAVKGHSVSWVMHLIPQLRPTWPSDLRKALKARREEENYWKATRKGASGP